MEVASNRTAARIALNLLYLVPGEVGGTETYAVRLLEALSEDARGHELVAFVNREAARLKSGLASNVRVVVCPVHGRSRWQRYYWEQTRLPLMLRRWRADIVHSLGYVGPLIAPCPTLVTVPDVNFLAVAEALPVVRRITLRSFSILAARRAARVVTISEFSKGEIVRRMHLPPEKVTVTHLGAGWLGSGKESQSWESVRARHALRRPYIVAFGGPSRHKNLRRLVLAFKLIADRVPHELLLLGQISADTEAAVLADDFRGRGRIRRTGYVSSGEVLPLLSHADLFVMPSLYEGFGLPVLEAQVAGAPVACSRAGSLPEVAGDGAAYFDPLSLDDIAGVVHSCLRDPSMRTALVERGRENARRFSWSSTARSTLQVYEDVLKAKPRVDWEP